MDTFTYINIVISVCFMQITECYNFSNNMAEISWSCPLTCCQLESTQLMEVFDVLTTEKVIVIAQYPYNDCWENVNKGCMSQMPIAFYHANTSGFSMDILENVNRKSKQTIIIIGQKNFVRNTLVLASNMDTYLDQHGYYTFLYKWLIFAEDTCDNYLNSTDTFYHVLCIESMVNYQQMCYSRITMKTLVFGEDGKIFQRIALDRMRANKHFSRDLNTLFPNIQYRLNKNVFRIGSQIWAPFQLDMFIEPVTNATIYTGMYAEVIREIALYLNMSFEVIIAEDGNWGNMDENGTWNGMIGQIIRKEVDFVISTLTVSTLRREAVDFADRMLETAYVQGMYRKPKGVSYNLTMLLKPFQQLVWIICAVAAVTMAFTLYVVERIHLKIFENSKLIYSIITLRYDLRQIASKLHLTTMALFGQSLITANRGASRFIWASWLIFCLIIASIWLAKLVS